jgi:hypothetical protein
LEAPLAGLIVGLLLLAYLGADCGAAARVSEKARNFFVALKSLVCFATLILGIILWVKIGHWIGFVLPIIAMGILITVWEWGFNASSKKQDAKES